MVIRWRGVVIAGWIAVVVVGMIAAGRLPGLLSTSLAVPGTGSQQADAILTQHFGDNIEGSFTVVLRTAGASARTVSVLDRRLEAAARAVPTGRATALRPVGGILYGQISTSLDLQQAASETGTLRQRA